MNSITQHTVEKSPLESDTDSPIPANAPKHSLEQNRLPSVTFNIAVLNEEKRIQPCLKSIASQNYPKNKIEINLLDAGSTDKTSEIGRSYGANIVLNEKKLPEPGLAKGYKLALGDYVVFMAADNVIHDPDWLKKTILPFLEHPESIILAFTRVTNDPKDNIWSKYLNEDTDPFNAFVYGNASHPEKFRKMYEIEKETEEYIIYKYTVKEFPLIALAQCTVLKKGWGRKDESDDITPVIQMIAEGKKIAYVKNSSIYHYSLDGFQSFRKKFKNRIYNSMTTNSYARRANHMSAKRTLRQYLFLLYAGSIILPAIHGIALAVTKRKPYMLAHPIACGIIAFYILYNFVKTRTLLK